MKRNIIKSFRLFEEELNSGLTAEQEEFLNECTKGTWSFDKSTGLVDVDGDFDYSPNKNSNKLKDFKGVKFGKISGYFDCQDNKLTSLEGAPQEVGGGFNCSYNSLTSLAGAPQEVGESFYCQKNKLTSLAGAPREVGWYFNCRGNDLTSLAGAPREVGGGFDCRDNNLTSLEGAPREVGGGFDCRDNNLTSLAGAPREVGESFLCNAFELEKGEWNTKGWLKLLVEGSAEARMLISTILSPEVLNREITKNPSGMIMTLKGVWNNPEFRETRDQLEIPDRLKPEMELLGDLGELGF